MHNYGEQSIQDIVINLATNVRVAHVAYVDDEVDRIYLIGNASNETDQYLLSLQ